MKILQELTRKRKCLSLKTHFKRLRPKVGGIWERCPDGDSNFKNTLVTECLWSRAAARLLLSAGDLGAKGHALLNQHVNHLVALLEPPHCVP